MRARSYTLYSKQAPLKKADSSPPTSTSPTSKSTPSTTSSRYTADYLASIFDSFGPISECKVKDVFAGDFQSTCPVIPDNLSSISTSIGDLRSRGASYISCDDYLEEMELEEHKPNKVSRIMVIGTGNVEKYAVINRIYPQEDDIATQDNAKFDLITRKIEKDMETERYHFWVREAGQGQRRHGALFNVYYRSCEVFFLVYNEDDRESFEVLEREIQMIQEAKGDKELKLVLISNKGRKSEVREEEVRGLKDKYKVKMHIEGDEIEGKEEDIREMIAEMMK